MKSLHAILAALVLLTPAAVPNQPSVRIGERQATFLAARHVPQGLVSNNGLPLSIIFQDACVTIDQVCTLQSLSTVYGAVAAFQNLGAHVEVNLTPDFDPAFALFSEEVTFRSGALVVGPEGSNHFTRSADLFLQRTIDVPRAARAFWINEEGFDVYVRVVQYSGLITGSGWYEATQNMTASLCTTFGPNGPMDNPVEGGPDSW